MTREQDAARRIVAAAQEGIAPDLDDMRMLADAVLDAPLVRAALEVRAGSAWATTRALELAAATLAPSAAEEVGS